MSHTIRSPYAWAAAWTISWFLSIQTSNIAPLPAAIIFLPRAMKHRCSFCSSRLWIKEVDLRSNDPTSTFFGLNIPNCSFATLFINTELSPKTWFCLVYETRYSFNWPSAVIAACARPIKVPNREHDKYPAPPHRSRAMDATRSKFHEQSGLMTQHAVTRLVTRLTSVTLSLLMVNHSSFTSSNAMPSETVRAISGAIARCWSWYFMIGKSDFPAGPTVSRVMA